LAAWPAPRWSHLHDVLRRQPPTTDRIFLLLEWPPGVELVVAWPWDQPRHCPSRPLPPQLGSFPSLQPPPLLLLPGAVEDVDLVVTTPQQQHLMK